MQKGVLAFYTSQYIKGIQPDPDINLLEWSDTYRELPSESSIEPGRYRSDRAPYVKEILEVLSPTHPCNEVVFQKGTQLGATEIANNFIFCAAHLFPGPILMALPTGTMATKHSKKKIAPSIAAMDCLRGVIKEPKGRSSGNTLLLKEFPGGSLTLTGSNSPAAARSDSVRYLILDDFDGFEIDVGEEGDPKQLYSNRTDAFGNRKKIYINSTPTIKNFSLIEREYKSSSRGKWYVPCPLCGALNYLEFGFKGMKHGLQYEEIKGRISKSFYVCKKCAKAIEERYKTEMLRDGEWIHEQNENLKRGFKLTGLNSPLGWLSWSQICQEYHDAAGKPTKMKAFINARCAEAYEEKGSRPSWKRLKERAEQYRPMFMPQDAQLVSVGVDVQENRLAVIIVAWKGGPESWVMWYGEIAGDTMQAEPWNQLDGLLMRPYGKPDGTQYSVLSCGVDSGGRTTTQVVYSYCRSRQPIVMAVKGSSSAGKPVISAPTSQDVFYHGLKIPDGVQLWMVGTDTAKATIYSWLANKAQSGPSVVHFHNQLDDDFYLGLTAEQLITEIDKSGFPKQVWKKTRERNEPLDCFVYAYAAAQRAGLFVLDQRAASADSGSSYKENKQKKNKSKQKKSEPVKQKKQKRQSKPRVRRW